MSPIMQRGCDSEAGAPSVASLLSTHVEPARRWRLSRAGGRHSSRPAGQKSQGRTMARLAFGRAGDVVVDDGRVGVDEAGEVDFLDDRISAFGLESPRARRSSRSSRSRRHRARRAIPGRPRWARTVATTLPVEPPERRLVVEVFELAGLVHRDDSTSRYRTSTYEPDRGLGRLLLTVRPPAGALVEASGPLVALQHPEAEVGEALRVQVIDRGTEHRPSGRCPPRCRDRCRSRPPGQPPASSPSPGRTHAYECTSPGGPPMNSCVDGERPLHRCAPRRPHRAEVERVDHRLRHETGVGHPPRPLPHDAHRGHVRDRGPPHRHRIARRQAARHTEAAPRARDSARRDRRRLDRRRRARSRRA